MYITEGPFDAMTLYDYNATCLMNLKFEDPKILKLAARKPKRIIFVPQWDETEEKHTADTALNHNVARTFRLAPGIPVGILRWYDAFSCSDRPKDINEAQVTEVDENLIEWRERPKPRPAGRDWSNDDYEPQSATATRGGYWRR